ncbi:hypothetical protein QUF80_11185 [Desulfococcaceae bacterium HSG8]|nr:hypothetical protein [Desulfococcaceae bacterium HSG8]
MALNSEVAEIFKGLGNIGTYQERKELERKAMRYTLKGWKGDHIAMVVASGALTAAAYPLTDSCR